ncbi:MAG: fused MFS/spermidine synthase [Isosphaerales bacterium]
MLGVATRLLPYALAFTSSMCIMILELVSSRLVARHVGASLTVWTSVIGIILGGICLGNVLGGRLADRVEPRRAVGPLFALSAFLTLSSLWMNAYVGHLIPSPETINWELRTVLVVTLDFLVPATVLGMIGPVVAKMAVEQAKKTGSAIGDVYFWGAIGSIVGTYLCGFVLMDLAPSSTILLVVAAALALLAAALIGDKAGLAAGLLTALMLGLGSIPPLVSRMGLGAVDLGSYQINYLALAGNAAACVLAVAGMASLVRARRTIDAAAAKSRPGEPAGDQDRPRLGDLAVLAFVASLAFMALEMVAGRLVQRHLGSSIYGWTSIIGVLLAGLSFGNFLGGKIADFVKNEKQASWLFMAASMLILSIIVMETQPQWLADRVWGGEGKSLIGQAIWNSKLPGPVSVTLTWPFRILFVVTAVFLLPALTLGTVSPVVAKLAVDRLRRYHRTGTAIGQVYAWGMVGSIIGTFLTGFVLIDFLGTKGVILILGTTLAIGATLLGSVWHAIWAGIPLGLCVLAFTPPQYADVVAKWKFPYINGASFQKIGDRWGIREEVGNPDSLDDKFAWIDESNYYFIKIENERQFDGQVKRTLVLDNLIHGYFFLGHPERLDYDYEHIYALVAYRAAKASGKVTFASAPEPGKARGDSPKPAAGLRSVQASKDDQKEKVGKNGPGQDLTDDKKKAPPELSEEPGEYEGSSLPVVLESSLKTLFLGGGAYCFQRHMQYAYPGTGVDVAEIDPSVTRANFMATGLPRDTTIQTYWGDARQFVELHQDTKKYDIVFGDAFNDFSVPWHLTTREFNEKLKKMLTPNGLYMINIIDAYTSDETVEKKAKEQIEDVAAEIEAEKQIKDGHVVDEVERKSIRKRVRAEFRRGERVPNLDEARQQSIRKQVKADEYRFGGFVGAWTRTARLTFPHVYIFGTDAVPGTGDRETFVVVASNQKLDLDDLGIRDDDPKFYKKGIRTEPKPYGPEDEKAIEIRSRNIFLTDDYAPVDNLLAPVAETRGRDED